MGGTSLYCVGLASVQARVLVGEWCRFVNRLSCCPDLEAAKIASEWQVALSEDEIKGDRWLVIAREGCFAS